MTFLYSTFPFLLLLLALYVLEAVTRHGPFLPARTRETGIAFLYRAAVLLLMFSSLSTLSARPFHAAFVSFVISAGFVVSSTIKRSILAEPLVITDLALLKQAWENPRLYYLDALAKPWVWGVIACTVALLVAATFLWFSIEPPLAHRWPFALLFGAGLAGAFAFRNALSRTARALDTGSVYTNTGAFGLLSSLILSAYARFKAIRPSAAALHSANALPRPRAGAPRLVVALQLESFVDLASRGLMYGPSLDGIHAMRQESLLHGSLTVPAEGAYTMRTEAAVLTGLSPDALGVDATDPYLALDRYHIPTLASRFREAGYRTVFLHPHDERFFRRNRIMPALGFDHFISGKDFHSSRRYGPYVCDEEIGRAILALAEHSSEPLFVFAVTLENHGPWAKGRLEGIDDPVAQYYAHLAHTDQMVSMLHRELKQRAYSATLCAWGDHVPARTLPLDVGERLHTDYWLWNNQVTSEPAPLTPLHAHDLARVILEQHTPYPHL